MMQQAPAPWGFGREVHATPEMLWDRIDRLKLKMYHNTQDQNAAASVYYYDVFIGLTGLIVQEAAEAAGEVIKDVDKNSKEVAKIRKAVASKHGKVLVDPHEEIYHADQDRAARTIRKYLTRFAIILKTT